MPRKVVRKERGVFEKEPGSDIWWIRFKDAGVVHWEKVGRSGDAIQLYKIRKADILRGVKRFTVCVDASQRHITYDTIGPAKSECDT